MDLSTVSFKEFRNLQSQIRDYVKTETFKFAGIRLESIEEAGINEIIRNLLESYIGKWDDFTYNDLSEQSHEKWRRYVLSFDVHKDTLALFLRSYGIDPMDYLSYRNQPWFSKEFRRRRDECLFL